MATTHTWHCGRGHTFEYGNEDWHYENNQGFLDDGSPIPMYCTEVLDSLNTDDNFLWGDPCMDSTSLRYN